MKWALASFALGAAAMFAFLMCIAICVSNGNGLPLKVVAVNLGIAATWPIWVVAFLVEFVRSLL